MRGIWGCGQGMEGTSWGNGDRSHLQVPAWYLRALTLCLWAANVRTRSPVSASQHLTVLSALPEYTCRLTSWGRREAVLAGISSISSPDVETCLGASGVDPPDVCLSEMLKGHGR